MNIWQSRELNEKKNIVIAQTKYFPCKITKLENFCQAYKRLKIEIHLIKRWLYFYVRKWSFPTKLSFHKCYIAFTVLRLEALFDI